MVTAGDIRCIAIHAYVITTQTCSVVSAISIQNINGI